MVPERHADRNVRREENIDPGAEPYQAEQLPALEILPRLLPAYHAPGDDSCDLVHDDADIEKRVACPLLALWGGNGRIAFWSGTAEDDILGIDPDGTSLGVIVKGGLQPAWAPRGHRIAFKVTDPSTGAGAIWIARADGTHRQRVVGSVWDASEPAWAPDGDHLVFVRDNGGDTDLVIADLTTGQTRLLRNNKSFEFEPSWSPDGSLIAFSSDRHQVDQHRRRRQAGGERPS